MYPPRLISGAVESAPYVIHLGNIREPVLYIVVYCHPRTVGVSYSVAARGETVLQPYAEVSNHEVHVQSCPLHQHKVVVGPLIRSISPLPFFMFCNVTSCSKPSTAIVSKLYTLCTHRLRTCLHIRSLRLRREHVLVGAVPVDDLHCATCTQHSCMHFHSLMEFGI